MINTKNTITIKTVVKYVPVTIKTSKGLRNLKETCHQAGDKDFSSTH